MWLVSFDIMQYRFVIRYIGAALTIFGVLILGIDIVEGLPMVTRHNTGINVTKAIALNEGIVTECDSPLSRRQFIQTLRTAEAKYGYGA